MIDVLYVMVLVGPLIGFLVGWGFAGLVRQRTRQ